jgi:hypothetical protein
MKLITTFFDLGTVPLGHSVEMDRENNPKTAIEVPRIEPLDLSPLKIDRFTHGDNVFQIEPPLELKPILDDESKQLLVVEEKQLDLLVYASTREELEREVNSYLRLLCNEYANEVSEKLTPATQALQTNIRQRLRRKD